MERELIFITGATGFVGSATAIAVVKGGYRLRISPRKHSDRLQALLSEYSEQVEFITHYMIYLAHPLPSGTDKEYYFTPAVKVTSALLKEAARVPSIKKVVITSSIAALMPLDGIPPVGVVKENNDWDFNVDEAEDFTALKTHEEYLCGCTMHRSCSPIESHKNSGKPQSRGLSW
ncbi:hypothetical protein BDV24DRAFT_160005 [Aspergillus arachidicola]|uniref:NAD-dependent epimerase/dehydratase domain-containing protein n=1 Tax=Aspergillus arachidicola TaxID=656916 RepID=A0A5N6YL10_9EURO|nr:hypothetical protein BDV24DRAFT_160005 [Aspergillus arachidicola]